KNLFMKEPRWGQYRATTNDEPSPTATSRLDTTERESQGRLPAAPRGATASASRGTGASPQARRPGEGRYAPARPAAIFGAAAKQQAAPSIFGDDLVSDKSLDEVILSYLAEDLDPSNGK